LISQVVNSTDADGERLWSWIALPLLVVNSLDSESEGAWGLWLSACRIVVILPGSPVMII
jgi:hypothetical protein